MALKRKLSTVLKDEERVSKLHLRSGRTIETPTSSPRRPKVVTPSPSSNARAKSTVKIARIIDSEDESDENHDDICLTSLQSLQAVGAVHSKKALSNGTNMDWTSADMGLVEEGPQSKVFRGKASTSKAKLAKKTVRGIATTSYCYCYQTDATCR